MTQQLLFSIDSTGLEMRLMMNRQWLKLVGETLPAMAMKHDWPISLDHCFMRVCLDTALGAPWHTVVRRPAIKYLSDEQLLAAISIAKGLVQKPETLDALNRQSIEWRQSLQQ
jgi:hypothetical protein